jgi:hypothetical protein
VNGIGDLVRRLGLPLALALIAAMWWADHRPVRPPPGPIDGRPAQAPAAGGVIRHNDHELEPLADFAITARVLSRENYRFDRAAVLSPVDLALGWGPMSDDAVLRRLTISQGGRWYFYRWSGEPPIPVHEIVRHSANMHLIPADDGVAAALSRVRPGHIIELRGQLVEARGQDGFRWRSSLTREDSGDGACEIVYVERIVLR